MSKLPRVKGTALISALRKAGFEVMRTKGSHHYLKHKDGRATVVPVHREIPLKQTLTKVEVKNLTMV